VLDALGDGSTCPYIIVAAIRRHDLIEPLRRAVKNPPRAPF